MNSQIRRESAQILQFPPLALRQRGVKYSQANIKQNIANYEVSPVVCGGAWYHEAAMIETGPMRKP